MPATATAVVKAGSANAWRARPLPTPVGALAVQLPDGATVAAQLAMVAAVVDTVHTRLGLDRSRGAALAIEQGAGQRWVHVPPDVHWLLGRAAAISVATFGAYDLTAGPTRAVLARRPRGDAAHERDELQRAAALIDHHALELRVDPTAARLEKPDMRLWLAPVARGYALQLAGERLRMAGARRFQLRLGGQWLASGGNDGDPWEIPLAHPALRAAGAQGSVRMRDGALAVCEAAGDDPSAAHSGHVGAVDPRGQPAEAAFAAVLHESPTTAQALACALLVLGAERGLRALVAMSGVEALVVDRQHSARMTEGMRAAMRLAPKGGAP